MVWHLKKCVCGLSDASLYWYNKVRNVLTENGASVPSVDPAVFYWFEDTDLKGVLAIYLDDFIWAGSREFESKVIKRIRSSFLVSTEKNGIVRYVGLRLSHGIENIELDQFSYVKNILLIVITKARTLQKDSLLNQSEVSQLRSLVGQILWAANQTRPDISFDACMLAAKLKNARVQDILDANKVVKKIKSETVILKFQHLGITQNIRMGVFSNASLANLPDAGSQGGNSICLPRGNGKASPLRLQSKKIRRIVRSTLTGEALAMSDAVDAVDAAAFLAGLYSELMFNSCLQVC